MKMLVVLSKLVSAQANSMEEMPDVMVKTLNYCTTHVDDVGRYKALKLFLLFTATRCISPS